VLDATAPGGATAELLGVTAELLGVTAGLLDATAPGGASATDPFPVTDAAGGALLVGEPASVTAVGGFAAHASALVPAIRAVAKKRIPRILYRRSRARRGRHGRLQA
jgi:hypothetical protein